MGSQHMSMVKLFVRKEMAAPHDQFIALHAFNAPKQTISEYQLSRNEREHGVLPLIRGFYLRNIKGRSQWSQWSLASYHVTACLLLRSVAAMALVCEQPSPWSRTLRCVVLFFKQRTCLMHINECGITLIQYTMDTKLS